MFLTNNASIQEVLFFPQMKPEKKQLDLNDNESAIFNLLKENKTMNLQDLKSKVGLSNKKWENQILSKWKVGEDSSIEIMQSSVKSSKSVAISAINAPLMPYKTYRIL